MKVYLYDEGILTKEGYPVFHTISEDDIIKTYHEWYKGGLLHHPLEGQDEREACIAEFIALKKAVLLQDTDDGSKPVVNMKTAWLWIFVWYPTPDYPRVSAELLFSSKEAFAEAYGDGVDLDAEQLVPVQVPENFTDWDYIPDNY